jgi:UDP-N-acetylglucosamine acyltransferase
VKIHHLAVVSPRAELGQDIEIGPFCVIEPGVVIGPGCRLESRVVVKAGTTLGAHNEIAEGAVLGGLPQHARQPEHPGALVIGSHNVIRENATIHRALEAGHATTLGDHNLVMVNAHIAHDCHLGSHTIVVNNVMLAGHVTVDDRAYLAGAAAAHQFVRIGRLAMVGGMARLVKDVPPFVTVDGGCAQVVGLNLVGLKRAGYTATEIGQLKDAYQLIYRSGMLWTEVVAQLGQQYTTGPAALFHAFIASGSKPAEPELKVKAG